ncbi:BTB/POZ and MATH domain-containing protein 2 [Brachypodium distachyon]|uniref:BTB domain-containing protein n=1 Tax=Brachypodium distachyon TaxID=15368 RepID=I1GM66_BRADI|nr:BTB/POZ and MATH domain-containing protein 2 [Brachypodium distachyon]KQK12695.1 hypothetical protein BRADI_1g05397v3 [Brachypodium distachyon]|eukprot:XP_003559307.1 BTB/POZ and MATH domain-containing protein 2 [Brachypodium distachyon]
MATLSVSRCTAETEKGAHTFEINGYSLHRGHGVGRFLRSANFTVGGHLWSVVFYPDGCREDCKDFVCVGLQLMSWSIGMVHTSFILSFLHPTNIQPSSSSAPVVFNFYQACSSFVCHRFMKRSMLEKAGYIVEDNLKLHCTLTVSKLPRVGETMHLETILPPPSDITEHLMKLLETQECTDVIFVVQGEEFPAHKLVMAMRSPVFKAQLYGQMMEKDMNRIIVPEMQPFVFRVLLHFIYTDALPSLDDLDGDSMKDMIKHLLLAADRYLMERLKLVCESILCKELDVKSLANMLALADQHSCTGLKDACIEFVSSSSIANEVAETQAYKELKRTHPSVVMDMWEKIIKRPRT